MKIFRRRRTPVATYTVETTPMQLKILRSHVAAITGELSTLRVQLGQLVDAQNQIRDALTTREQQP